jgi:hypothetical protein
MRLRVVCIDFDHFGEALIELDYFFLFNFFYIGLYLLTLATLFGDFGMHGTAFKSLSQGVNIGKD